MLVPFNYDYCYYCKRPFSEELPYTRDHVVPSCKGGRRLPNNVVLACPSCNSHKSDWLLHQWADKMLRITNKGEKIYGYANKMSKLQRLTVLNTLCYLLIGDIEGQPVRTRIINYFEAVRIQRINNTGHAPSKQEKKSLRRAARDAYVNAPIKLINPDHMKRKPKGEAPLHQSKKDRYSLLIRDRPEN